MSVCFFPTHCPFDFTRKLSHAREQIPVSWSLEVYLNYRCWQNLRSFCTYLFTIFRIVEVIYVHMFFSHAMSRFFQHESCQNVLCRSMLSSSNRQKILTEKLQFRAEFGVKIMLKSLMFQQSLCVNYCVTRWIVKWWQKTVSARYVLWR